ncbi:hypothetical protein ACFL6G_06550 [candidate division KSB1 bacterium]
MKTKLPFILIFLLLTGCAGSKDYPENHKFEPERILSGRYFLYGKTTLPRLEHNVSRPRISFSEADARIAVEDFIAGLGLKIISKAEYEGLSETEKEFVLTGNSRYSYQVNARSYKIGNNLIQINFSVIVYPKAELFYGGIRGSGTEFIPISDNPVPTGAAIRQAIEELQKNLAKLRQRYY